MLNKKEINDLIVQKRLVADYIDLETQLTPNGFDLTVSKIFEFRGSGALDFSNKERILPKTIAITAKKKSPKDKYGWWNLKKGIYKVLTNESVMLPLDLMAVSFPRSSLLRMGIFTHTGVWDAGFCGKSEFVLAVENLRGVKIKENARIVQLIFTRINEVREGYNGVYQNTSGGT